jgi:glycosyltransferase involved in cell wall biosynthesis
MNSKSNDKLSVSVIIPAYNNREELERTLESVMHQTYCNLEIIVTDDGSDVDLLPVIAVANDSRICYYKMPHANANVARNFGIRKSKGKYVAMLDSGDLWHKEHLMECMAILSQSDADGLYGSLISTRGAYEQTHQARELTPVETMAEYLIVTGSGAQTLTLFMSAGSIKDILWDENLNRHQDYDFVIRYARKYKWIVKKKATVIHPLVSRKDYDFDACIRFIRQYKSEISDNILIRYYRSMLLLAKNCNAPRNITSFYVKELNRLYPASLPKKLPGNIEVSVIMPVYNVEKNITVSMESILRQSFTSFELIVIDNGSTDDTLPLIRSFHDRRIVMLQTPSDMDMVKKMNMGLQKAKGKYITLMNPGDMMHIDLLKIQHVIMEEEQEITVCGAWNASVGNNAQSGKINLRGNGLIEQPVIQLLNENFLSDTSIMIRKFFLTLNRLQYNKNYPHAEDYKLWFDIAKQKGVFYIESQPLMYYSVSEAPNNSRQKEQEKTCLQIRQEILEYLLEQHSNKYPELSILYDNLQSLQGKNLFRSDDVFSFFYTFFTKNSVGQ